MMFIITDLPVGAHLFPEKNADRGYNRQQLSPACNLPCVYSASPSTTRARSTSCTRKRFRRANSTVSSTQIRGLLFNEHTSVVIDPAEERLKDEFGDTSRVMIPLHAVIRIDEVEKRGQNMIFDVGDQGNVTHFPSFGPGPGKK